MNEKVDRFEKDKTIFKFFYIYSTHKRSEGAQCVMSNKNKSYLLNIILRTCYEYEYESSNIEELY